MILPNRVMPIFLHHFGIAALAVLAWELLRVYEIKHELTKKKYLAMVRSPLFWAVNVGMVAASGFFATVYFAEKTVGPFEIAIFGIAARAIVRNSVSAATAQSQIKLAAGEDDARPSLRELFK